ncbi:hypothetical protein ACFWGI_06215 [Streptomyces niveus]|uniref:hypothetical protein n=1 Tax=Streptomyces niveus TaxID=193462 RepID=UPI0036604F83
MPTARLLDTTPLRYTVPGQEPIQRHCRTWALADGTTLSLITELPDDQGMSITNAAEEVRTVLEMIWGVGCRIAEHYMWHGDEHYDEQSRTPEGGIRWDRLSTDELRAALGTVLEGTRPSQPLS